MKYLLKYFLISIFSFIVFACSDDDTPIPVKIPKPGIDVVKLPVVIHVIHNGEEIGVGSNLSVNRILRQVEILNEDFRKKEETKGYNNHPDGADVKVEFVLAKTDPESNPINGINRIDASKHSVENIGYNQNHYAQYAYWNPSEYINIWITPLSQESECLVLGHSTGPITDLPGTELLVLPKQGDAEGILINWIHFGESNINCHAKYGRTLTHEMGHYLGLLHTWGGGDCEFNDYCNDTPAVDNVVFGRTSFIGCAGDNIMIGNYMNYSDDDVMNIFTYDQAARIHYVLINHQGRNSLMTSPALN
ncbi:M43 family zinc metalloprotease [Psychroserpens damuponensis]|uniref:M43 family zinc metalloprotease n=1 Tax=Psychroserpens damuponensis TaxID=943936 RepID=UPI00058FA87C|nr:M43 family zinc metalloprotease [Psychroserpens damuponensis]